MTDSMQSDEGGTQGRGRSSTLVNRNVTIQGRRTSLRLEPAMWDALHEIAQRESTSVHELCTKVELDRQESTLTAAIRVYILGYYREATTAQGHSLAGHGQPRGIPESRFSDSGGTARNDRPEDGVLGVPSASRRG
jgi:predicted DNA-binding ribbon-helix-helix protein